MAFWVLGGAAALSLYAAWPNPAQQFRPYQDQPENVNIRFPKGAKPWSIKPDAGVEFEFSKEGAASKDYGTVIDYFKRAVAKHGNEPALKVEKAGYPADRAGEWETYTWSEYYAASEAFAKALLAGNFKSYSGVTICGFNHPSWHIANMGTIMAQGLAAGSYTTNSHELCHYVADHSKSEVIVVDTMKNAEKFTRHRKELTNLRHVVVYLEDIPAEAKKEFGDYVLTFSEFIARGSAVPQSAVDERIAALRPRHCCSLIYTSGTTGNPKACMISHDNMCFVGNAALISTEIGQQHRGIDGHSISFLPLSHIAGQVADIGLPIILTADYDLNWTVWFGRPDALKGSLPITLKAVRPTFFFGVPRVWEKFVEGIKAKAKANPATGAKQKLVNFAKRVGKDSCMNRQVGGNGYIPRGSNVASKLVHSKVREALGLDRCMRCYTGAAPIQRETLEFLGSLGIDVLELYGMSETTGPATMCAPYRFIFGSCGYRLEGCELKCEHVPGRDKKGEGEICFRGRHCMMGYLNNEEKTRETIDEEGWLHSGDVGSIDEHGMLRITGRIKELIIGAGGENIAPVPIEDEIKRICPAISNIVMIGDKRKYNVALVTIKAVPNLETGEFTDELFNEAKDVNPAIKTVSEAIKDPKWEAYVENGIKTYNGSDACPSNAQKIQKFRFLPTDLSVPGGELTGTLKVKRTFVNEKHSTIIESMY